MDQACLIDKTDRSSKISEDNVYWRKKMEEKNWKRGKECNKEWYEVGRKEDAGYELCGLQWPTTIFRREVKGEELRDKKITVQF